MNVPNAPSAAATARAASATQKRSVQTAFDGKLIGLCSFYDPKVDSLLDLLSCLVFLI